MGRIELKCLPAASIQPPLGVWKTNKFNLAAVAMFLMNCVTVLQIPCLIYKLCFSVFPSLHLCQFQR